MATNLSALQRNPQSGSWTNPQIGSPQERKPVGVFQDKITKSWHFDPQMKVPADLKGKEFLLVPATGQDIEKIARLYVHHPVPGYEIASIKAIYNPTLNRSFESHLKKLQNRQGNSFFNPKWSMNLLDKQIDWRQRIHDMFLDLAKPYSDSEYPDVKLLPLWHGTYANALESICQVGYANPSSTDAGFFGRGLYGAHEAEYPYRVYFKGAFFLNFVAIFSAYPVVKEDGSKLLGKGNFENYDAHFIPVSPRDPSNSKEVNYDPCFPFTKHTYTEVVVFESAACLPRYLIELQPILTKTMAVQQFSQPEDTPLENIYQLGLKHFNGQGVKRDFVKAMEYFQSAASKSYPPAQFKIGFCYREGLGVQKNESEATQYFNLASKQNVERYFQTLAERRISEGQFNIGYCFEHGIGYIQDFALAFKNYQLAADQGHAGAQKMVGTYYFTGKVVKADHSLALKFYQLSADQGYPPGQYNVGRCYFEGKGIQQHFNMAAQYFKLAGENGNVEAIYLLGFIFFHGKGEIKQDFAKAAACFQQAVLQNHVESMVLLGLCYSKGNGVKKDKTEAVKYFKLAADQHNPQAQNYLGICYLKGKGVMKNSSKAKEYFTLASQAGLAEAKSNLRNNFL